ncbi:hypothetical protein K402DRAFT_63030 [Aulographum hederae CBS 113979]|uniref:Uncharacterized protein n=1 Tax=Aulographum hederae CBS 113979 TaxID=1176131 RepID=A0A6G1H296_9PEZI|nr:hypothetical protein K402DRAFT_63030 [Aulographum hederae CBS 113979]
MALLGVGELHLHCEGFSYLGYTTVQFPLILFSRDLKSRNVLPVPLCTSPTTLLPFVLEHEALGSESKDVHTFTLMIHSTKSCPVARTVGSGTKLFKSCLALGRGSGSRLCIEVLRRGSLGIVLREPQCSNIRSRSTATQHCYVCYVSGKIVMRAEELGKPGEEAAPMSSILAFP